MFANPNTKLQRYSILGVLLLGATLRLWQYLGDPSQFVDEIAISRNVLDRDVITLLTEPLRYDQSAPPGFLLATSAAITLFGTSDYAFRLFPIICSLVSLWLFLRLTTRFLAGTSQIIALVLFSISPRLIYNAANVKQYASDVLVCLVLLNIVCHLMDRHSSRRDTWYAALVGAVCTVFSWPAGIVLTALWATLMLRKLTRGEEIRDTLLLGAAWIIPAGLVVLWAKSMMSPETMSYMKDYWRAGFPPIDGSLVGWLFNLIPRMIYDYTIVFQFRLPSAFWLPGVTLLYACAIAGVVYLYRRDTFLATVIASPLLLTIGLAATHQYPFARRTVTFLIPIVILAMSASLRLVERRRWISSAVAVLILTLPAASIAFASPPVIHIENVKPLFEQLRDRREPDDIVWIYYAGAQHTHFYDERYGLSRADYTIGRCRRGEDRRGYLRDLDAYRGEDRVWVFITHPSRRLEEDTAILGYLHAIGTSQYESQTDGWYPSSLHLFDLDDQDRLASMTADKFDIPPLAEGVRSFLNCTRGPISAWKE